MRLDNPGALRTGREYWLAAIAASLFAVIGSVFFTSCGRMPELRPTPTPPQPTPVYAAEVATKLPPVLFVMLDWMNGDWSNPDYRFSYIDKYGNRQEVRGHPEYGALGGWAEFHWNDLNPGKNSYDWTRTDKYIKDAQAMRVMLPDGSVIAKPVGIAVVIWTADATADRIGMNYIPGWISSEGGGSTFSCYDPDGASGECKPFCTPKYTNTVWQYWFDQFLMAMGKHYDNNPEFYNLAWLAVATGVDEEVVERKDLFGCDYQSGDSPAFTKWCYSVFESYNRAFPNTPHFIQPTMWNTYAFSQQAASFPSRMSGVKCNGLEPDVSTAEVRYDGVLLGGVTGFSDVYHEVIPTGYEPKRGNGIEGSYWFFMQGLATHPYMFDIQLPNISDTYLAEQRIGFPIMNFVRTHLGKSIQNTPDVWIVLRETYFKDSSWRGSDGVTRTSGPHHGDFEYWLYRSDSAPGSRTVPVQAERLDQELPSKAHQHIYGWHSTRRTDQASGNPYMSFDIEDRYPYAGQVPKAAGGQVTWTITLTLLNSGNDAFSLEYLDYYGNLVQRKVSKGAALGTVDMWVDYVWTLDDAYFNNGLPGGMDFRIDCNTDGNEYIHRLIVRASGPPQPTPTVTNTRPPTATPAITPTPTQTRTPTRTPTGTITPPTPTRTATASPTRTHTPTSGPSPTPTSTSTVGPSLTPTSTPTTRPSPTPTSTPTLLPGGHNVVTLQQGVLGYQGTSDTYISTYTPAGNFCLQANLLVKNDSAYESLLRFDLSSMPPGSTIHKATLKLYAYNRDKNAALDVQVYRLLRMPVDAQATWERAAADNPWGEPGANNTESDRAAEPVAVQTVSAINTWYEFDITGLVSAWCADPQTNRGLILRGLGQVSVVYHFASANHTTISLRPQLVIDYTAPETPLTPIPPTPTSTATLTLTPSATLLISPTASATPTPSRTFAPTPTHTHTPTPTVTPTLGEEVTITLQQDSDGYMGCEDTYIYKYAPDTNYSNQTLLKVGYAQENAALLRFDLSTLPSSVVVTQATLHLYAAGWSGVGADISAGVYAVLRNVTMSQATWNVAGLNNPWGVPGCNDTSTDRRGAAESVVTTTGINKWYALDVTHLVQEWMDGSLPNHGILVRQTQSASNTLLFASADNVTANWRPKLVISYRSTGEPTPGFSPTPTVTAPPILTATPTPTVSVEEVTITLQQGSDGYTGCEDTYIYKYAPDTNYSNQTLLRVGYAQQNAALVRFDLSALPSSVVVTQATLHLYAAGWSGVGADISAGVYAVLRNVTMSQATWNVAGLNNPWGVPGCDDTSTDRRGAAESVVTTTGINKWYALDVTHLVQEWMGGSLPNRGVLVRQTQSASNTLLFASADNATLSWRPKLVITYRGAGAPAPTFGAAPETEELITGMEQRVEALEQLLRRLIEILRQVARVSLR